MQTTARRAPYSNNLRTEIEVFASYRACSDMTEPAFQMH